MDPQTDGPAWEGRVECVRNGRRAHVRGPEDLARFIAAETSESRALQANSHHQEE